MLNRTSLRYWSKIWPIWKPKLIKRAKPSKTWRNLISNWGQSLSSWNTTTSTWPTNAEEKAHLFDRQKSTHRNGKAKTKAMEKCLSEIRNINDLKRYTKFCWSQLLLQKIRSRNTTTKWACWCTLMLVQTKNSSRPSTGHIKFWQKMRHGKRTTYLDFRRQKKLWTTKTDNSTVHMNSFTVKRSYNKFCEWIYCLILSEWCTLILLGGGQCECHTYLKRCSKNLGFQG